MANKKKTYQELEIENAVYRGLFKEIVGLKNSDEDFSDSSDYYIYRSLFRYSDLFETAVAHAIYALERF